MLFFTKYTNVTFFPFKKNTTGILLADLGVKLNPIIMDTFKVAAPKPGMWIRNLPPPPPPQFSPSVSPSVCKSGQSVTR